ncbi:MAG: GNAT family N-acetyltransferase [Actinomycetota bacterium]|nr:GNAT family N-acetyltransferase [Actinomycetota bacterium]
MSSAAAVHVRLAHPDEYDDVGALTEAAYRHDGFVHDGGSYAESLRDARRRAGEAELWVATLDGTVVGTVTFCPPESPWRELARHDEAEFRMLAVAPAGRRRGVGRALVQRCVQRSRELHRRRLVLCSDVRMRPAHVLYAGLGFVRIPERDWSPLPGVHLIAFGLDL